MYGFIYKRYNICVYTTVYSGILYSQYYMNLNRLQWFVYKSIVLLVNIVLKKKKMYFKKYLHWNKL